jgi:hypothetical protein
MSADNYSNDLLTPNPVNLVSELNQNENTFNKLRDLQSLVKKESALKELCKKLYINLL